LMHPVSPEPSELQGTGVAVERLPDVLYSTVQFVR